MGTPEARVSRPRGRVREDRVTLAHGAGGKAMRDLIDDVFAAAFDNALLAPLEDQARIALAQLAAHGDRLAFTTDSYVIDPLLFPGGDIGMLAVNGTVNDLAMGGARPLYLSCSAIIEEGLPVQLLRRIAASMAQAALAAKVDIVTGDTKVVPRGAADKLFLNTAGVGVIPAAVSIGASRARAGDAIVVNGTIGDHGASIVAARQDLGLVADIESDCQPLAELVQTMLAICPDVHCLRDPTRGGLATVLSELALGSGVCMQLDERRVPVKEAVRALCEILGLDPLYLANEGKLVAIVPCTHAHAVVEAMRAHPAGRDAALVGEVTAEPRAIAVLRTMLGGERVLDMLVGEQLPRIC